MAFRGVLTDMRDGQTSSSSTISGTLPGSAVAGDACIIAIFQGTGNTATTPSGWTVLSGPDAQASTLTAYVYGKVLSSADITAGSLTITWSGSGRDIGVGIVMSGEDGTTPFQTPIPTVVKQGSGSSITAPAVGAGGATQDVCVIVGSRTSATTAPVIGTPSGWTSRDQNATNFGAAAANAAAAVFTNTGTGTVTPGSASLSNTPNASIAYTIALDAPAVVSAALASGTGQGFAPTLSAGATVAGALASGTGQAFAPTVDGGSVSATVNAALASGTGQAFAPTLAGGANVAAALGAGTGQAFAPTVTATASATVNAALASGTGQAFAPVGTGGANVTLVRMLGTVQTFAPAGSGGATFDAPAPFAAVGLLRAPTVAVGFTVNAPLAAGTAILLPPAVRAFNPRDIELVASNPPDRWAVREPADRWDVTSPADRWRTKHLEDA